MFDFIVSGIKGILSPINPLRMRDRFELSLESYEDKCRTSSWRTLL